MRAGGNKRRPRRCWASAAGHIYRRLERLNLADTITSGVTRSCCSRLEHGERTHHLLSNARTRVRHAEARRRPQSLDRATRTRSGICWLRWLETVRILGTTAASAEEALGLLRHQPSAVALCDIRMPGHDGVWLAEKIREQFPETAVIMATGVQDVAPALQALRQGVIDYLTKPFDRERLREAVTRGLEFHQSAWDARLWRESLEQEMAIRRLRLNNAWQPSVEGTRRSRAMISI